MDLPTFMCVLEHDIKHTSHYVQTREPSFFFQSRETHTGKMTAQSQQAGCSGFESKTILKTFFWTLQLSPMFKNSLP